MASLAAYFQNLLWSAHFQIAVSMLMLYALLGVSTRGTLTHVGAYAYAWRPQPLDLFTYFSLLLVAVHCVGCCR